MQGVNPLTDVQREFSACRKLQYVKRIVNVAAQYCPVRPRYHAEHTQRVLVMVLVIRAALAAYQHAAAPAACPQVLRVRRPGGACEVAALLDEFASTARNAAGVPVLRVVSDVLRPAAVAIRTVSVLVGKRAAMRDAEQLRLPYPYLPNVILTPFVPERLGTTSLSSTPSINQYFATTDQ